MTLDEAYALMMLGKAIRRPSWLPNRYMILRDGVELTMEDGKIIAYGYREFPPAEDDYEVTNLGSGLLPAL
jgi:hypothetical protein